MTSWSSDDPDYGVSTSEWVGIVRRTVMSGTEKSIAGYLAGRANPDGTSIHPGIPRMVRETGWSWNVVKKVLKRLRDAELIELVKKSTGRDEADLYRLILGPKAADEFEILSPAQHTLAIRQVATAHRRDPARPAVQPTTEAVTPVENTDLQPVSWAEDESTYSPPGGPKTPTYSPPDESYSPPGDPHQVLIPTTKATHQPPTGLDTDVTVTRARPRLADLYGTAKARGIPVSALLAEIDAPPANPEPGWGNEPTVQMPVVVANTTGRHAIADPDENVVIQFRLRESRAS